MSSGLPHHRLRRDSSSDCCLDQTDPLPRARKHLCVFNSMLHAPGSLVSLSLQKDVITGQDRDQAPLTHKP